MVYEQSFNIAYYLRTIDFSHHSSRVCTRSTYNRKPTSLFPFRNGCKIDLFPAIAKFFVNIEFCETFTFAFLFDIVFDIEITKTTMLK